MEFMAYGREGAGGAEGQSVVIKQNHVTGDKVWEQCTATMDKNNVLQISS